MAGRMSNRDRIAKVAAEKAAERKEKAEKKKKAPARKKRATKKSAAPASGGRMKVVWAVCDQTGNSVKTYPYPARKEADTEAARLTESKSKPHFVRSEKVPMED
jgi:hypothetical protein